MAISKALFSSKSEEWETPQDLFNKLNEEFHFNLDVCATSSNTKCLKFYDKENDGLSKHWTGICWMNPPYGRNKIDKWVKKAYESSFHGATVVCLLPARTDTQWWHDYCAKVPNSNIRFLKGRIKFVGGKGNAPFPSVIVIFRPQEANTNDLDVV